MSDDQIISERASVAIGLSMLRLCLVLRGLRDDGADFARAYKRLVLERGVK